MTLDEAIKHCLEVVDEQSRLYSLCPCPCDGTDNCMSLKNGKDMGCTKCAADHRQLADRTTCDNNCDCECVLDFIHVDENGECCELTDNPYKEQDGEQNV